MTSSGSLRMAVCDMSVDAVGHMAGFQISLKETTQAPTTVQCHMVEMSNVVKSSDMIVNITSF